MAKQYQTPGVYVEKISKFPPSVAGVATAIPAFIGYTEIAGEKDKNEPVRITNLLEYEARFGKGAELSVNADMTIKNIEYVLYDSIRLFYDNGGSICYIVSVGQYGETPEELNVEKFKAGITTLKKVDEVTLLLFPDAVNIKDDDTGKLLGEVQNAALQHCKELRDRFAILDVKKGKEKQIEEDLKTFRDNISSNELERRYGAAYYPYLSTIYKKSWTFKDVYLSLDGLTEETVNSIEDKYKQIKDLLKDLLKTLFPDEDSFLKYVKILDKEDILNSRIKSIISLISGYAKKEKELNDKATLIPPSGAIAGIYSSTDQYQGVWKAPANVSIASLSGVSDFITNQDQESMNVDSNAGKSINAIRAFSGKDILVWGARTLDGNSNEWRYIPVRRLFNYIEESVQKSTSWAVFSPNDGNTWVKIKSQIENFLNNLWRAGALAGSSPESAYFVNVGLGNTMTREDILNGYLYVDIGIAAVRPAEFIILRFSHKLQE